VDKKDTCNPVRQAPCSQSFSEPGSRSRNY